MTSPITHRYDFVLLFDVTNGNPNGDPDAGNSPRIDPETGHGLVSDVCLKRKIRNFVTLVRTQDGAPAQGYDIYVKERAILNQQHQRAYTALGLKVEEKDSAKKIANQDAARQWMCQTFFDIRMFGAVMGTEVNAGQVRGPVQIAFARSIDPIVSLEQAITRMAVTTEKESAKQEGGNRTMGRKEIVPYALYRAHGFVSPHLAAQTGFSDADLELLCQALTLMFETDRSAARGEMSTRGLYVFAHDSALGNAPAHRLFERISVIKRDGTKPARRFEDYEVGVDRDGLPVGVELRVVEPAPRSA
jgi:CRISPR-associated protein Csd2